MKILITGNPGYAGCGVVKEFRTNYPEAEIIGFDIGILPNTLPVTR